VRKQSLKNHHPAGILVRLKSKDYRFCYLINPNGICSAAQLELPDPGIVMILHGYKGHNKASGEQFDDWGVFLAGDKLVVAQWKYFERLAS